MVADILTCSKGSGWVNVPWYADALCHVHGAGNGVPVDVVTKAGEMYSLSCGMVKRAMRAEGVKVGPTGTLICLRKLLLRIAVLSNPVCIVGCFRSC